MGCLAPRSEVTLEHVIRDMVGRKLEDFFAKTVIERGELLDVGARLPERVPSAMSTSTSTEARCSALPD